MKLLVKIPSRERPGHLRDVLLAIGKLWSGDRGQVRVLISADTDDDTMSGFDPPFFRGLPMPVLRTAKGTTKVEAINRDVADYPWRWDVLLNLADDMIPVAKDFDRIVRATMEEQFPDTDGCLWFGDGRDNHPSWCTIACMGRKWWEYHGRVIYHPSYKGYQCDREQTIVATQEGKLVRIDGQFFEHHHPMYGTRRPDPLLRRNQKVKGDDRNTFSRREKQGFPA